MTCKSLVFRITNEQASPFSCSSSPISHLRNNKATQCRNCSFAVSQAAEAFRVTVSQVCSSEQLSSPVYAGSFMQFSLRAAQFTIRIAMTPQLDLLCHCCRHTHAVQLRVPRMQPQARSTSTPPLATVQLQSTEAPAKAAPAEPELAAHFSSLLPVRLHDSTLSVQGHKVVSGLSARAFRSPDVRAQEQQGVLLGLAGGLSAALRDFNLGQVSCHWCYHPVHPELILVPDSLKFSLHPVLQLQCRRFLSSARIKLWWQTPEWGRRAKDIQPGSSCCPCHAQCDMSMLCLVSRALSQCLCACLMHDLSCN